MGCEIPQTTIIRHTRTRTQQHYLPPQGHTAILNLIKLLLRLQKKYGAQLLHLYT